MTPLETVLELISARKGMWEPVFDVVPTPMMRKYFSISFISLWTRAMVNNDRFAVFDGDPMVGIADPKAVFVMSTSFNETGDIVLVDVHFDVVDEENPDILKQKSTFVMVKENEKWVVEDIDYNNSESTPRVDGGRDSTLRLLLEESMSGTNNKLISREQDLMGVDANILASRRDDGPDKRWGA